MQLCYDVQNVYVCLFKVIHVCSIQYSLNSIISIIQFKYYSSSTMFMFKIIHTLVHHFPLVVYSISLVLYDCWYSMPIGAHTLFTQSLWEFGLFFLGKRLKLGQIGLFPGHHSGLQVLPINSQWDSGQDTDYATPGR